MALATSHDNDERPPSFTIDGVAENDFITGRLAGAVGVGGVGVLLVGVFGAETVLFAVAVLFVELPAEGPQLRQMQVAMTEAKITSSVFFI